jgi:7-cyano-7-deazaguanine synthase in queuosine biosynthesis
MSKITLPKLTAGKKMAVMFSGGLASTMIAVLAIEKYGIENVVAVFTPISDAKSKGKLLQNRIDTFEELTTELGITNKVMLLEKEDYDVNEIDNLLVDMHRLDFSKSLITILSQRGHDVQNLILGNAKLDSELNQLLALDQYEDGVIGNINEDGVRQYVEANSDVFPEVIAHGVLDSYTKWIQSHIFYKVEEHNVIEKNIAVFPFANTTKKQIVALYNKKGLGELLSKTKSCSNSLSHCGTCKCCIQREIALS